MTPSEINEANAVLHAELATAYGPLELNAAIAIGEALTLLPDFAGLDFSEFDIRNYMKLYALRDRQLMQWMRLIYDSGRVTLKYEVI